MSYSHTMPRKDPAAVLDYEVDWADEVKGPWLAPGETIATFDVTCQDDTITITDKTQSSGKVRWWLSGGIAGRAYDITVEVLTSASPPRKDHRTVRVPVGNR